MKHAIERILVAVKNPDAKSLPAVAKAIQIARPLDIPIELYHVIDSPLFIDQVGIVGETIADVARVSQDTWRLKLEGIATRVRRHGVAVSTAADWDFPAYEAIVRRALRIGADLIIAEQHPRHHILPALLRLADWELLRLASCPVLLVKRPSPYRHPVVLTALDTLHAHAKPGALDEAILETATIITGALSGELHAMHAYPSAASGVAPKVVTAVIAASDFAARAETILQAQAQNAFRLAIEPLQLPQSHEHLVGGEPTDAIAQVAQEIHASIVVMGAVSRSGLKRMFIGNTAEGVLDRLNCDLLIVKPDEFDNRIPLT